MTRGSFLIHSDLYQKTGKLSFFVIYLKVKRVSMVYRLKDIARSSRNKRINQNESICSNRWKCKIW